MSTEMPPRVSASDIGKAEYCAYSLYLAKNNVRPSKTSQMNMHKGTIEHRRWDNERVSGPPSRIKLAIAVGFIVAIILIIF